MGGRTRISLLACTFALVFAGCGSSSGTIPEGEAGDLLALLDTMQDDVEEGQCDQVPGTAEEIENRVKGLPSEVDSDVRTELEKAAANLDQLATKPGECEEVETGTSGAGGVETTTTTTEEAPTTTAPEEETSTEEETTSTEEEPSTEEETTTETPSGNQGENGADVSPPPEEEGPGGDTVGPGGGLTPPSGGVGAGGGGGGGGGGGAK